MNEWNLMIEMAKASNKSDDEALSELIMANDFANKEQAVTMAISGFQLTKENVGKHILAAKKLISLPSPKAIRESFRQEMLKDIIAEVESSIELPQD